MKKIALLLFVGLSFQAFSKRIEKVTPFDAGKRAFDSGKYTRALELFARSIASAPDPGTRNRAYYFQGLTLFELGHYYSSYLSFRNVLLAADDSNKEVYEKAIKNSVIIMDRLNMVEKVGKILNKLPEAYIPSGVADLANYAMGSSAFVSGQYDEANGLFKSIHPQSLFYIKALFYLGVLSTRNKNYKEAVYYFDKVRDLSYGKRDKIDMGELARLNLARSVYSSGDMEESIELYAQFLSTSPHWLTILLEAGWPLQRVQDTTVSLGNLHTVLSPFYREDLVGEGYVLRATILFSLCKYEEMRQTIADFFSIYDPVLKSMQSETTSLGGSEAYYQAFTKEKGLNRSFINFAKRDGGIIDLLKVQKMIREERENIARYGRNEQMRKMGEIMEETFKTLSLDIGSNLNRLHKRKLQELIEQREQANYLKVEIVTGEKELIENQKGLPPRRVVDVETSVAQGFHFWPFTGEYWEDELGSFVYTTESSCIQ